MNRATSGRVRRRKNPVAIGSPPIHPTLVTESPIKAFVVSPTGEQFKTICVQQDDGSYLAVIEGNPRIRRTAKTRGQAEVGVRKLYMESFRKPNPAPVLSEQEIEDLEDEEDMRVLEARRKRGLRYYTLEEVLKDYGRVPAKN